MKASKPEPPEEHLVENPYEFRESEPPWFTIFSFLSVPVLTLAALPFVKDAVRSESVRDDLPNPGQFDGVAVLFVLFLVAGAASLVGLILAHFGRKKVEPWMGLRVVAWMINGTVALFFFYSFGRVVIRLML